MPIKLTKNPVNAKALFRSDTDTGAKNRTCFTILQIKL
nr:MAG TPA: hypothetical protein [Caudoviricetes sp.]